MNEHQVNERWMQHFDEQTRGAERDSRRQKIDSTIREKETLSTTPSNDVKDDIQWLSMTTMLTGNSARLVRALPEEISGRVRSSREESRMHQERIPERMSEVYSDIMLRLAT